MLCSYFGMIKPMLLAVWSILILWPSYQVPITANFIRTIWLVHLKMQPNRNVYLEISKLLSELLRRLWNWCLNFFKLCRRGFLQCLSMGISCTRELKWLFRLQISSLESDSIFSAQHLCGDTTSGISWLREKKCN